MKTAFISGHLDLTQEEFNDFYLTKIMEAYGNRHNFVVGDARGTDTIAQKLLNDLIFCLGNSDRNVTVYHMFTFPRNNIGNFKTKGGFKSDEERDAAMTAASEYDIAWVRPGREKSGTQKNIDRRKKTC